MTQKALIVDDIAANVTLMDTLLRREGFQTLTSTRGIEGYSLAATFLPDIIFVDFYMPEDTWDGGRTVQELKQHPLTCDIPVVLVTGASSHDLADELGCAALLPRPFRTDDLRDILSQHFSLHAH